MFIVQCLFVVIVIYQCVHLQFSGLRFVTMGLFRCASIYYCLCVCVFLFHTAYLLYYCEPGWVDLVGLKPDVNVTVSVNLIFI